MGLGQLSKWVLLVGLSLIYDLAPAQSLRPNLPQFARMLELESRDLYVYCDMQSGERSPERRALKDLYRLTSAARNFAVSLENEDFKGLEKQYDASILTWPQLTCFAPRARAFDSLDDLYRKIKIQMNRAGTQN